MTESTHATMAYGIDDKIYQFDHYNPFIKTLALNYPIQYIMKGVVKVKGKKMIGRLIKDPRSDKIYFVRQGNEIYAHHITSPELLERIWGWDNVEYGVLTEEFDTFQIGSPIGFHQSFLEQLLKLLK